MGLLDEDDCWQRLKQGEEVGQALAKANPTNIYTDYGGWWMSEGGVNRGRWERGAGMEGGGWWARRAMWG